MRKDNFLKREIEWLLEEKYYGKLTKAAKKDIRHLKQGEPLAYLIGNTPFLGCKIDLSLRSFIPRPETEYWTDFVIQDMKKQKRDIKCLDIFAGSGCIGVAILKNVKHSKVDFIDIDKKNLEQIKLNLKINDIFSGRYKLIHSDIFKNTEDSPLYDYILANPPYVGENEQHLIQSSVVQHEPAHAYLAGEDGLDILKRFLKEVKYYLAKDGKIYLEFGFNQKLKIKKLLDQFNYQDSSFFRDQYNKWRYVVISNQQLL